MTGGNPKGSSHKSSASASSRKSRWESGNNPSSDHKSGGGTTTSDPKAAKPFNSNPKDDPSLKPGPSKPIPDPSGPGLLPPPGSVPPFPMNEPGVGVPGGAPFMDPTGFGPPPAPAYGFHMLERRTIFLADGSVRSYLALPPDYQDFPPQGRPMDPAERFLPFGPGSGRESDPGRLGLGFDNKPHFPPGGLLSPEAFRREREREELFGRGGGGGGGGGQHDYWNSLGLDGRGPMQPEGSMKRKYGDGDERDGRDMRDEFSRQRQQLLQYGNSSSDPNGFPPGSSDRPSYFGGTSSPFPREVMESGRGGGDEMRASKYMRGGADYDFGGGRGGDLGVKQLDVDPQSLKKAFLRYVKTINENASQRRNYLEDGRAGPLQCLACGRTSKDFPDVHSLVMHAYDSRSPESHVDHLGLHKALCVLMGWNYAKVPDNTKAYQSLSAKEAEANKDDLILWPPMVIIHNTNTGRGKEGRMEGLGNKVMDNKLKDLGFAGGKSKSLYGKEGHQGITLVKFGGDSSGLKEAMRLGDYFEKDKHGRKGWAHAQSTLSGRDDESNPNLVKVDEKAGDKKRIFYGYLATVSDLEKVDFDTRKKANIESKKELEA